MISVHRVLLAFVSKGGATETYARVIADTLGVRGYAVDLLDLRKHDARDLSGYECVIVGLGVRIGMLYRKGKRMLKRKDLRDKNLAIFLSSGIAVDEPEKSKAKFLSPLVEKYRLAPVLCDVLPGKLPGPGGQLDDRTDADLAARWAEKLAERLASRA